MKTLLLILFHIALSFNSLTIYSQDSLTVELFNLLSDIRRYPLKYGIRHVSPSYQNLTLDTALSRACRIRVSGVNSIGPDHSRTMDHGGIHYLKSLAVKFGVFESEDETQ